jgi:type II secretory pathway component PulM
MLEGINRILSERIRVSDRLARLRHRALQPLHPYAERVWQKAAPAWAAGQGWYEKREPREKVLLQIAGALIAVMVLYGMIYSPIMSLRASLDERVAARVQDLIEVRALMPRYERLQRDLQIAEHRTVPSGPNFSLFSVIEQSLTRSVGRERIASITPSPDHQVPGGYHQYTVDVKLTNLSLAQVVNTLYGVQSLSVPISVSNLQLRQHPQDTHVFDADLICSALGKDH